MTLIHHPVGHLLYSGGFCGLLLKKQRNLVAVSLLLNYIGFLFDDGGGLHCFLVL
jgi:hypothetical protein